MQFSCGFAACFALVYPGQLYAWGRNDYGQLGPASTFGKGRALPTLIKVNLNYVIPPFSMLEIHCTFEF